MLLQSRRRSATKQDASQITRRSPIVAPAPALLESANRSTPRRHRQTRYMTALQEYLRLESTGLWRPNATSQRRDVYVFLGDASIVIADKAEQPLAHWSLPAVERRGTMAPALFAPGPDSDETLEIEDQDMVDAISRVQAAVRKSDPKPGRVRLWTGLVMAATIVVLGVGWLPLALVSHAARIVPEAKRVEIGQRLLEQIAPLTGRPCGPRGGSAELRVLALRLPAAQSQAQIIVVPDLPQASIHIPGGMILLDRSLIEDFDTAEVATGFAVMERLQAQQWDPLARFLSEAGIRSSFSLLTTGTVSDAALADYAPVVLRQPALEVPLEQILNGFETARVAATPYATALDVTGEQTIALIEADPFANFEAPELLPDNAWVTLQSICDGA